MFDERAGAAAWLTQWCRRVSIGLFVLGLILNLGTLWEAGLTSFSLATIAWFSGYVIRRGVFFESLLLLFFFAGYSMSWCVGFLGYRYVLPMRGFEVVVGYYTVVTAGLVLAAVAAAAVGGWLVLRGVRRPRWASLRFDRRQLTGVLGWFAAIFVLYQIAVLAVTGVSSRWEIGNYHEVGSDSYLVVGLRTLAYPFYLLLGISLRSRLFSGWNLGVAVVLAGLVGMQSLTGGRTTVLEPVVLVFIGSLLSELSWRRVVLLGILGMPVVLGLLIVIGMARGSDDFMEGGIGGKLRATTSAVRKGTNYGNAFDDPWFILFGRLFESSGQVVIDNVTATEKRVYFLNCERLLFLFVPRFLAPTKQALDDGNQRLVTDYGYPDSLFSSNPITLIADAYERFGWGGVMIFHLFCGALLAAIGRALTKLRSPLFCAIVVGCFCRVTLLLYPESNLGLFHAVFYSFARDIVIISVVCIPALQLFRGRSVPTAR